MTALALVWTAVAGLVPGVVPPSAAVHATLAAEGPSWTIAYEAETRNNTVFGLLREAGAVLGFGIEWVEYGLPYEDVLVTAINGTRSDGTAGLWWQYCVNHEYARLGAVHQEVRDGDLVTWVYAPSGGDALCV